MDPWPQCCYLWVCILQGIVQSEPIATGPLSLDLCLRGESPEWNCSHSAVSGSVSYRVSAEWPHSYRAAISGSVSYRR